MHAAQRVVQDSQCSLPAKFTAAHRLLRENGFGHVIRAENISDKYFKIFFVRNDFANARLGIIVAKKIISGAADRNHVKRIIREVFRQHSISQYGLDLVVMVRQPEIQEHGIQAGKLIKLFSLIVEKNRCAEF